MSQDSRRPFPLRQERSVDWVWCSEIAERRRSEERMRFPLAKDPVQRRPVPAHQRLWSDASVSKLASPGTCRILHASVQVPVEKSYVWLIRHASWNEFTNSLLHERELNMLINSAPLRHDRDRNQSGHTLPCTATWARSEQFEWSSNPPYSPGTSC
jgi:hypothetical protein